MFGQIIQKKRPKPSLFNVTPDVPEQLRITTPPTDLVDFNPQYLTAPHKITWIRKSDIAANTGDLWSADPNGDNANVWIQDVGLYSIYPSR